MEWYWNITNQGLKKTRHYSSIYVIYYLILVPTLFEILTSEKYEAILGGETKVETKRGMMVFLYEALSADERAFMDDFMYSFLFSGVLLVVLKAHHLETTLNIHWNTKTRPFNLKKVRHNSDETFRELNDISFSIIHAKYNASPFLEFICHRRGCRAIPS